MLENSNPIHVLREEYAKRRHKNATYSLRAFAKRASVSAGLLSDIMKGKRRLTHSMAHRIARRLEMPKDKQVQFVNSARESVPHSPKRQNKYHELPLEQFKIISEWHHYGLLSLLKVHPTLSVREAAKKLGLSYFTVSEAVDRLKGLGLLSKKKDQWGCADHLTTMENAPDEAVRSFKFQFIQQALRRLDYQNTEKSDYSTMVMAINKKNITQARTLISNFRRDLCKLLETGEAQETYALNIQLFSLEVPQGVFEEGVTSENI